MRRAEAPFTIQMIVSLGLLFVVCASIAGLIMYHINIPVDDKKARADIFVERVLSREGILYVDPVTDRVLINVIDASSLSILDGSDWGYQGTIAARISLEGQDYFVDQRKFVRAWPLVEAGIERQKQEQEKAGPGLDVPLELPEGVFRYKIPLRLQQQGALQTTMLELLVVISDE